MRKSKHHLFPKSRCREFNLNADDQRNIIYLTTKEHEAWHLLFNNKTPEEIVFYIIANWFPHVSYCGGKIRSNFLLYELMHRR